MKNTMQHFRILILMFCSFGAVAQQRSQFEPVEVQGMLSAQQMELLAKDPHIYFYTDYLPGYALNALKFPIQVAGNTFKARIPMKTQTGYISFGKFVLKSMQEELFLVESGDRLHCNSSNPKTANFTGKGAERLNFQLLSTLASLPSRNLKDSVLATGFVKKLNLALQEQKDLIAARVASLPYTSQEAKKILTLNAVACIEIEYIQNLSTPGPSAEMKKALENFYQNLIIDKADQLDLVRSFMKLKMNYLTIRAYDEQYGKDLNKLVSRMYDDISHNYTGMVKEKLLAFFFIKIGKRSPDLLAKLPELLTTMRDQLSKKVLQEIAGKDSVGVMAYPFSFTGLKGEKIKLDDFKGKIVILDTWFNGCSGCLKLARLMEPVAAYFKGNKDVVFLSINGVDPYDRFIRGVKEGKYGSAQSVYGYTGGLGLNHPTIKHYQYKGFPNLLIIGKGSKIISSSPDWPSDEVKRKAFIQLIEQNL